MPARGKFVGPSLPTTRMDWEQVARLARRGSPGHWYQAPGTHTRAVAAHIRSGRIAAFRPAGAWEARYLPTDDPQRFTVFLRPAALAASTTK
jgi:hypothetical protein